MFIDYVTLMLVNMSAGLFLLGYFLIKGLRGADSQSWSAAFAIIALIALVTGFHMSFTWPLPDAYNIVFGELTVLFGAVYAGIALSLAARWKLSHLAIFIIVASLTALILGSGMIKMKLSGNRMIAGAGFILAGVGGLLTGGAFCARENRSVRVFGAIVLFLAAAIWGLIGGMAYWGHLDRFKDYRPVHAGQPPASEEMP